MEAESLEKKGNIRQRCPLRSSKCFFEAELGPPRRIDNLARLVVHQKTKILIDK
jgi:hypothetical protein